MTRQTLTLALSLGLLTAAASADNAKPRGSGGGGGSSSAGMRHHSPSGGSGSSGSGGTSYSGSPSSPSGSGLSQAERRHPRAGTGSGGRYYGGRYYYPPYYYYPGWGYWYSPGYWPGYYYGYSPYWGGGLYYGTGGYGFYGGGYYGGGGGYYRSGQPSDAGALRILVDPEDTKVYVDGYYAGEVDDFDGMFQRLHVSSGRHEITLKKDGYITHRIRVYVGEDATLKLRHDMEKGSGPDTLEDLAGERGLYEERRSPSRPDEDSAPGPEPPATKEPPRREEDRNEGPMTGPAQGADTSVSPGLLTLAVTPDDASVYVDGRFFGSARQTGEIELPAGPHRVEIVRPGYRTVDRRVVIEAGRMETLAVALERP
jgi:PEGA domain